MPKLIVNDPVGPVQTPQASAQEFGAGAAAQTVRLGRTVSSIGDIGTAWLEQKTRRNVAEYKNALAAEAQSALLTNDLENAPKAFEQVRRRLESQYRGGFKGAFDAEAKIAGDDIENRFRHGIKLRQIQDAENDLTETLRLYTDDMANADDPSDRAMAMIKADLAIDGAFESNLIDGTKADRLRREFATGSISAIARKLKNEDPSRGLEYVNSDEFPGTEEERAIWTERMVDEIRARATQELTDSRREEIQRRQAQLTQGRDARKSLYEKATLGGGITVQDVMQFRNALEPSVYEDMLDMAVSGGKPVTTGTDPDVYRQLTVAAEAGGRPFSNPDSEEAISFENAVFRAWKMGRVTQQDVIRLRSIAYDFGVEKPVRRIRDVVGGGILGGPFAKQKAVEAEQQFIDWYIQQTQANNGITPDLQTVNEYADQLIKSSQLVNTDEIDSARLRPLFLQKNSNGDDDYAAAARSTRQAYESGLLTIEQLEQELEKIKAHRAQQGGGN